MVLRIVGLMCASALTLAGCTIGTPPSDDVCGGVPADMGGCDPDQPTYAAVDCDGLAAEFGQEIDGRLRAIIEGPESVDGNGRSVRALNAVILSVTRLNEYLRDEGLIDDCSAPPLLAAAEQEFSQSLREHAGSLMTETEITGEVHGYDDWYALVLDHLGVIDEDEDLPFGDG